MTDPLHLATRDLKVWFVDLLARHGFRPEELREATLVFQFPLAEEYYCVARCRLETMSGKVFERSSTSYG
jgi:hypothetical protein